MRRTWDLALLFFVASCLLVWTWGTWPDVLVDFGQQLYLPWQISQGKVLYRDLVYINGPLPQYFNALLFSLFGTGLRTLVIANLALLAALAALLHRALRAISSRFAATTASLLFLFLFAFAQFVGYGNYNYLCPYTHEVTHGLLLSLVALTCLWQLPRRKYLFLTLGGLALGAAFLTKAEIVQAGALASLATLLLYFWDRRIPPREIFRQVALFLGAFLLPIAFCGGLLSTAMPFSEALRGTLGSWTAAGNTGVTHLKFFQEGMGTDDIPGNLKRLLGWGIAYLATFLPLALVGLLPWARRAERILASLLFLLLAGYLLTWPATIDWFQVARPFPLILLITLLWRSARLFRRWETDRARSIREVSLLLFALALTGKIVLHCRIYHYGFVLAMPATLLLVILLVDWIPKILKERGGHPLIFQAACAALLLSATVFYLRVQSHWLAHKTERVGEGADAFWADGRGAFVNAALSFLATRTRPGQTLAVLPEGSMINYLARRANPARFSNYMPTEEKLFGEGALLSALKQNPPDLIALVHKDTTEFGYRFFGKDYAQSAGDWIQTHYQIGQIIGAPALETGQFGISLFLRK